MRLRVQLLVAALVACGGNTQLQSARCGVTISGALSGSFDCKPALTEWTSGDDTGVFRFNLDPNTTVSVLYVGVGFAGEPRVNTYRSSDVGASSGILINAPGANVDDGRRIWSAGKLGNSSTTTGSWTLTFTSIPASAPQQGGKIYDGEGSLDATLVSAADAGPITLHAAF